MLCGSPLCARRHQHADAIAKFQHQVGSRNDVGVVAADMQEVHGNRRAAASWDNGNADHARLADEDADIVERRAVLDNAPGSSRPNVAAACATASSLSATISKPSPGDSTRSSVGTTFSLPTLADHRDLHAGRQVAC